MSLFDSLSVSASGLTAERMRMSVSSENLANAQTTRTEGGGPYRRKTVVLEQAGGNAFGNQLNAAMSSSSSGTVAGGVQVAQIAEDSTPNKMSYDPSHPDANADGYVEMPNVDTVTEMVDLISASRAYEANTTAMQTTKQMFTKSLDLLR